MTPLRRMGAALPFAALLIAGSASSSLAQLTVFDAANYQQNVLTAARALEQLNNQVRQLQNEAQMLARMNENLRRLGATIAPDLQRTLGGIESRLHAGEGIALRPQATEGAYRQLFPQEVAASLSADDMLRNAKRRWEADYAANRRAALLQAEIADGIAGDKEMLAAVMARSRNAAGSLEAAQAGNELTGLGIKESLALQGLLAAQHRSETLGRARDLASEEEARQRWQRFLGTSSAYTASR